MLANNLLILLTIGIKILTNISNVSMTGESVHFLVVAVLLILIAIVVFLLKRVIDKRNESKYDETDTFDEEK
ncbi:hypothetical protein [Fastidiosipila sanguinis]|uniref:Uncharacterized protein n=1 Tax=Fastidiosipila sanguinis TaxID=236753 RepID=A0A2S0KPL2_9FIRM|nr:hypothetical protein [Fastidiosipila sanguinis]AVM42963.1 hypothetical protein C5Q98_06950 [Fastidiosipila sanguinis]